MTLAAAPGVYDPWVFRPHPDVWVLMITLAVGYAWALRRLGPRVVGPGRPTASARQVAAFAAGLGVLWLSSDWPLHDLGDSALYSAHMVQHLLLSLVAPPLLLAGTPEWLGRELLRSARLDGLVRSFARPVVAAVLFNAVVIVSHWPAWVDLSVRSGLFHFGAHTLLVSVSLLMWVPVIGPLPELRIQPLAAMLYLFIQSIVPTVPGAWLTFADKAIYPIYETLPKPWGVGVLNDQQAAGLIMKLAGGFYLWGWITLLFFRWAARHDRELEHSYRRVEPEPELTWDAVERQLATAPPAPPEP